MVSVSPVPDRFVGNPDWDAASSFRSYKPTLRSQFCQLVGSFFTNNTLVTRRIYQLNSVTFGHLHERLMAVPNLFWVVVIPNFLFRKQWKLLNEIRDDQNVIALIWSKGKSQNKKINIYHACQELCNIFILYYARKPLYTSRQIIKQSVESNESRGGSISWNKDCKAISTITVRSWNDVIRDATSFDKIVQENVEILSSVAVLRR
jgi:hypothetical protein